MRLSSDSLPALVQPLSHRCHQFWRASHVPIGIGNVSVAEISGQDRQTPPDIFSGAMSVQQCLNCETMTKVMQARAATGRDAANTNLSGNHVEDSTDLPFIQPPIVTRAEEVGSLPGCEQKVAACTVVGEDFEARRMKRDQPGLAELGVTDCENAFGPIDIGGSQV